MFTDPKLNFETYKDEAMYFKRLFNQMEKTNLIETIVHFILEKISNSRHTLSMSARECKMYSVDIETFLNNFFNINNEKFKQYHQKIENFSKVIENFDEQVISLKRENEKIKNENEKRQIDFNKFKKENSQLAYFLNEEKEKIENKIIELQQFVKNTETKINIQTVAQTNPEIETISKTMASFDNNFMNSDFLKELIENYNKLISQNLQLIQKFKQIKDEIKKESENHEKFIKKFEETELRVERNEKNFKEMFLYVFFKKRKNRSKRKFLNEHNCSNCKKTQSKTKFFSYDLRNDIVLNFLKQYGYEDILAYDPLNCCKEISRKIIKVLILLKKEFGGNAVLWYRNFLCRKYTKINHDKRINSLRNPSKTDERFYNTYLNDYVSKKKITYDEFVKMKWEERLSSFYEEYNQLMIETNAKVILEKASRRNYHDHVQKIKVGVFKEMKHFENSTIKLPEIKKKTPFFSKKQEKTLNILKNFFREKIPDYLKQKAIKDSIEEKKKIEMNESKNKFLENFEKQEKEINIRNEEFKEYVKKEIVYEIRVSEREEVYNLNTNKNLDKFILNNLRAELRTYYQKTDENNRRVIIEIFKQNKEEYDNMNLETDKYKMILMNLINDIVRNYIYYHNSSDDSDMYGYSDDSDW